jgi:hypothetical protein
MSTREVTERLATTRQTTFRESVRVRSASIGARLAEQARIDALLSMWAHVSPKPSWVYEFTRGEQRRRHPSEMERTLIHDGIRAQQLSREQVIAYRTSQLLDDLSQFGNTEETADALYIAFMREAGEAVEAVTLERGLPTPENVGNSIRQMRDVIAVAEMRVSSLQMGRTR